jgi:hypothetical protein
MLKPHKLCKTRVKGITTTIIIINKRGHIIALAAAAEEHMN